MFFKIGPIEKSDLFSWIISKNPSSVFEKKFSSSDGRYVRGQFDTDGHYYSGFVKNDNLVFLETARTLNSSNYLHAQLSCVCPFNLKGFDEIFRSSLRGSVGGDISKDDYFQHFSLYALFGPFPKWSEFANDVFVSVGIKCDLIDDNTSISSMVEFRTINDMSVTEFLQKIYLISYFLTTRYSLTKITTEQIEKFVLLCKGWLDGTSFRNKIINSICRFNKDLIKTFEIELLDEDDNIEDNEHVVYINEMLTKESLHKKRHNIIIEHIPDNSNTIVDFGCAEGKLVQKIGSLYDNVKIIAIDANPKRIAKSRNKVKNHNIRYIQNNILIPQDIDDIIDCDYFILTEVIEHLHEKERLQLLYLISNVISPKHFILTAPNVEYNVNYGMGDGEYRHRDHKIEYTHEQFNNEVIHNLEKLYDIKEIMIVADSDTQPSFVIFGSRKSDTVNVNMKTVSIIKKMYQDIYLEISNINITNKNISSGYASMAYMNNHQNIFYLAPTMSPVDYDYNFSDYLEHPMSCFNYYKKHGIDTLIGEDKYMGSRGYILAFKDENIAKKCRFERKLVINSRNGFTFFDDETISNKIYDEIYPHIHKDFIMIDAEILPWVYKANDLIERQFTIPGECALLSRKYSGCDLVGNAIKYIDVLNNFAADSSLEIRPFHFLMDGRIREKNGFVKIYDVVNGTTLTHIQHMERLHPISGNIFKPCNYHIVDLNSIESMESSIANWVKFCEEKNGEGFVYKPINFINYAENYYYIQPAMKVRGRDYLRLIYGIDYLEPDYFRKVSHRNILKKRVMAIQEFEMSLKMLKTFSNNQYFELQRMIAGFIGFENVHMWQIDATL